MPESISHFLSVAVSYAWGLPLVILLMGGGLYFAWMSKMVPLLGMKHALSLLLGKGQHSKNAEGQISHFQALTNALASTVGLGNIAGVAVAISQGGPGALFWMWLSALIGMNTKFFECTLAVLYRGKDYRGEVQGGPMYVIKTALDKRFGFLGVFFAVCGLVGTTAVFQANQMSSFLHSHYGVPKIGTGLFCGIFVGIVLLGGIKRIAKTTSTLVPLMVVAYVFFAVIIILMNFDKVPGVFSAIFAQAFTGQAAFGGAIGVAFIEVMKIGVRRAAFSNEAGLGTAPMAHSNVKTSEPITEGYVAMLGPFLDTIVICTLTALVILTTLNPADLEGLSGVLMTAKAFETAFPAFGVHFLGFAIFLFGISTIVGSSNYNGKCWHFLFKGRKFLGDHTFIVVYVAGTVGGSVILLSDAVNIIDLFYAMMAVPNIIACVILAPKVRDALKAYNKKYLS